MNEQEINDVIKSKKYIPAIVLDSLCTKYDAEQCQQRLKTDPFSAVEN